MNDLNVSSPIIGEELFLKREEDLYPLQRAKDPFAWTPLPGEGKERKGIQLICEQPGRHPDALSCFDFCQQISNNLKILSLCC